MTFYLVSDGPDELWVVAARGDQFHVYDPHTALFHREWAIRLDFYVEQELTFTPIDAAAARERIAAGVGNYDGRQVTDLLTKHRNDLEALTLADVLGDEPVEPAVPSARQRAAALVNVLERSEPGTWVSWQTYAPDKAQTARVAASDLRCGKVASVRSLGPVEAEVVPTAGDQLLVRIRRRVLEDPQYVHD